MKTINKGMLRAAQFRNDREAAGLPVASPKQLNKAQLIAAGQNRHHNTPLGLEQLGLQVAITRQDRLIERKRLTRELDAVKTDDTKADAVKDALVKELLTHIAMTRLVPVRSRSVPPQADRSAVESYLASNPAIDDPKRFADEVAEMAGYPSLAGPLKRVTRYLRSGREGRIPAHIRSLMSLISAAAVGADIIAIRKAAVA